MMSKVSGCFGVAVEGVGDVGEAGGVVRVALALPAGDGVGVSETRVLRDAIDIRGLGLSAVGVVRVS